MSTEQPTPKAEVAEQLALAVEEYERFRQQAHEWLTRVRILTLRNSPKLLPADDPDCIAWRELDRIIGGYHTKSQDYAEWVLTHRDEAERVWGSDPVPRYRSNGAGGGNAGTTPAPAPTLQKHS